MKVAGKSVVVTGGANGIGRALAERFAAEGARGVVVADINAEWARKVADRIGGPGTGSLGMGCDVADPDAIAGLVRAAEEAFGPVDIFCSNAGFSDPAPGDLSQPADAWRRIVDVNLMAHVWAARAVVPSMLARGEGYLLQTISSAALITGPSGMGYTLTKHGALGFAEWVALNHRHDGIRVVCLCPNAVNTGMLGRDEDHPDAANQPANADLVAALGDVVEPEDCAEATLAALDEGRFLALPHPRVGESFLRKAQDYDAWLDRTAARLRRMRGAEDQVERSASITSGQTAGSEA